jgi:hypothetical protein
MLAVDGQGPKQGESKKKKKQLFLQHSPKFFHGGVALHC